MKRWIILIPIVGFFFLLLLGLGSSFLLRNSGEVHIVNMAKERILKGEVEIFKQNFKLESLARGKEEVFFYDVRSESHYRIMIEFASGRTLEREVGYVTDGFDYNDTLIVKDDDIVLESIRKR